ncbi:MAG: DUF4340 domain-containing protein [Clostridia bacterium]|nr:DUF4340 domain-containing protein [Clostridia bacterium]
MTKRNNKVILITMAVLLVALVVVYFVVIAPLLEPETTVPEPQDGEGLINNSLTIYEPISESQLVSINVKNAKGEYTFKRVEKTVDNKKTMVTVIDGYEDLIFDESYYAYLRNYALTPITVQNQVYRECTPEQMAEYGVTADTCQATMTVTYKDADGAVKTHTLRIGHKAFTASATFYVALDGRNHVYRFSAATEGSILIPITDYISPIIYMGYSSSAEAMIDIRTFYISEGKMNSMSTMRPIIALQGEQIEDNEGVLSTDYIVHIIKNGQYLKSTAADYEYSQNALAIFYTNFLGDKVVAIEPDEAMLDEYGLGKTDDVFWVTADSHTSGVDLPYFFISQAIYSEEDEQNYYYAVAKQSDTNLLIRIPEAAFIPQNQFKDVESVVFDDGKSINWAATNTIGAGLSEALRPDGTKYLGVASVTIKVPTSVYQYGEETFYINYVHDTKANADILKVTSKSGRYTDTGDARHKPFNQLYFTLVSYPLASRYNELDNDTIEEILANPNNMLYTLEVILNPAEGETVGKVQRFEYYKINASDAYSSEYVILHVTEGYYSNGVFVESEDSARKSLSQKTVFDTTRAQITDYIYRDFVALMKGELEVA